MSFYNGGQGQEIPPTPVLMATGVVTDYRHAVTADLKESGDPIYLIGESSPSLGGSLYERRTGAPHGPLAPTMPAKVRTMGNALLLSGELGRVRAAHDVSDGGLGVALFEMAAGGGFGFSVDLAATGLGGPGVALVSEGSSRWVVEVDTGSAGAFERAFRGLPIVRLGEVTNGTGRLRWKGREVARLDIDALYPRWRAGWDQ